MAMGGQNMVSEVGGIRGGGGLAKWRFLHFKYSIVVIRSYTNLLTKIKFAVFSDIIFV